MSTPGSPRSDLYEINGLQFLPFKRSTSSPPSGADHAGGEPARLLLPDLLAYWLTGEFRTEIDAWTAGLLDAPSRSRGSDEVLEAREVPPTSSRR